MYRLKFLLSLALILGGCGGGSAGTGLGSDGGLRFAGQVVSHNGNFVESATVTLINTGEQTQTDEAGAFDFDTEFPGGDAALQIDASGSEPAIVAIDDVPNGPEDVDVSILFNAKTSSATLLDITLRARVIKICGPLFLNTRTVKQTAAVPANFPCVVETEIKSNGIPLNNLTFELQHRGCAKTDPWETLASGVTGTSGEGFGELEFALKPDQSFCVFRIVGPLNLAKAPELTAQINTLRKIAFDKANPN